MTSTVNGQRRLPHFVMDLLASCPAAGAGVHNWLFRVARVLHPFYDDKGELAALIASAAVGCGREIPTSEVTAAVVNSAACAWRPRAPDVRCETNGPRWPALNVEQVEAIIADPSAPGLADLWERSPVRIEEEACSEAIVDALFPGNPLLCCGWNEEACRTKPREEWRGKLSELQFIVPSPMSAIKGRRKIDGKISQHTLDNTGPRRFLVIEFDEGTHDQHAAVLWHLAQFAPLALAVHSGGKSVHGWFYCAGQPDTALLRFMGYAISLGADPATWTRSQFVRMPDGRRPVLSGDSVRQAAIYFNPETLR